MFPKFSNSLEKLLGKEILKENKNVCVYKMRKIELLIQKKNYPGTTGKKGKPMCMGMIMSQTKMVRCLAENMCRHTANTNVIAVEMSQIN